MAGALTVAIGGLGAIGGHLARALDAGVEAAPAAAEPVAPNAVPAAPEGKLGWRERLRGSTFARSFGGLFAARAGVGCAKETIGRHGNRIGGCLAERLDNTVSALTQRSKGGI